MKKIFKECCRRFCRGDLCDEELVDVGERYLSVYEYIVLYGADKEIAQRGDLKHYIYRICMEIALRCSDSDSTLHRRSYFIRPLYELSGVCDENMECTADEIADELIHDWLQEYGKSVEKKCLSQQAREIQTGVLNAIIYFNYGVSYKGMSEDEYPEMIYLNEVISNWCKELSESGKWLNVCRKEAVERVKILERNSTMLLNPAFDENILFAKKIYATDEYCCRYDICSGRG